VNLAKYDKRVIGYVLSRSGIESQSKLISCVLYFDTTNLGRINFKLFNIIKLFSLGYLV